MDPFDRLSPALQVQIVNGLGWKALRPVQQQAIDAILDGANCAVLAPTAGGKTEAAMFPLLSAMDTEDWPPTSVLYVAPIRALLNNQEARLQRLTGLLGRRAFKWHGDVGATARKRFIRDPTDVLAITPESLEAMLMSTRVPGQRLLSHVRAVVVDEVHAFACDDRGAHLVALLERIQRLSNHDIQRIGLSATVGDPEVIARWLGGSSKRPAAVVDPGGKAAPAEVSLDYVGSLANAALMVDKLHPGTRRLVFVDSRRKVEALGAALRMRHVNVHVTHSSLSASERTAAERAFEQGDNCVIVSTSALELGIDVGDLDHVYQVDAPSTVSSFLQRMGRTGRRPGKVTNCTFLATSDDAVLQAAALIRLWHEGYIEPADPDDRATHVLAHQLLALGLQTMGVPVSDWWAWVQGAAAFAGIGTGERAALVRHMLDEDILAEVDHRLVLGHRGERLYAGANFRDLYAVFSAPPVLRVLHGTTEIGTVDAWFAQQEGASELAFVLGGRAWKVTYLDWRRGVCSVVPAATGTYPRWMGQPVLLSREICGAMRRVLLDDAADQAWSARAATVMQGLRASHAFLDDSEAPLVSEPDRVRWWTFAGGRANNLLASLLREALGDKVTSNNLCVTLAGDAAKSDVAIRSAVGGITLSWERARELAPESARGRISKFQPCLPADLEMDLLGRRLLDLEGAAAVLGLGARWLEAMEDASELRKELLSAELDLTPGPVQTDLPVRPAEAPENPVHFIRDAVELDALCARLVKEGVVGFDVETTMDKELCLAQLATGEANYLVDAVGLDVTPLARVLESPRVLKVIHNATFEREVMASVGIDVVNVYDTLVVSRKLRGYHALGGHSLASVCERELGLSLDKGEQKSDWRRRPLSQRQIAYAALDAEVLVKLHQVLQTMDVSLPYQ